jgi:hypothetical protein
VAATRQRPEAVRLDPDELNRARLAKIGESLMQMPEQLNGDIAAEFKEKYANSF